MRTRCPECGTVFRVTSEQLRLRAGKVRCGHCQAVFNAFDQLLPEEPIDDERPLAPLASAEPAPLSAEVAPDSVVEPTFAPEPEAPVFGAAAELSPVVPNEFVADQAIVADHESLAEPDNLTPDLPEAMMATGDTVQPEVAEVDLDLPLEAVEPPAAEVDNVDQLPAVAFVEAPVIPAVELPPVTRLPEADSEESPEISTQAAREAGLVAARELAELQGYNRWAAGTLADSGLGAFDAGPARRAVWPFVLFSLLLGLLLLGQLLHHFRSEVVLRLPAMAGLYESLSIAVPLPRNAELVAIDASDLQSDNQRGLFVLQATLRNRAPYPQAWPDLELTLTDTADAVVSRRVLAPVEYLPPGTPSDRFPANGELAVRLWIEAKGIGAAGYRLYVFYP